LAYISLLRQLRTTVPALSAGALCSYVIDYVIVVGKQDKAAWSIDVNKVVVGGGDRRPASQRA